MPVITKDINTLLNSYFDKILVLTVDRFTQRQQKVKQRLEGLDFEFFFGADKEELTGEFISNNYVYNKEETLAVRQYYPPLNMGEIACSLSHKMIYQAMIDNDWKRVLIFEDDVVPDDKTLGQLENCLKELPENWELFYLGYLKNEKSSPGKKIKIFWYNIMGALGLSRISVKMINKILPKSYSPSLFSAGFHDCTHAYAISLEGARKLVVAQTPVKHRADNVLSLLVMKGELKAFAGKQQFFNQEIFTDTANTSYVREKKIKQ